MDFLKRVISTVSSAGLAPNFPYAIDRDLVGEKEVRASGELWTVHAGHNVKLGKASAVTIFIADIQRDPEGAKGARNALKKLKILRHPSILRLIDGIEADGKIYIATEPVRPYAMEEETIRASRDHQFWLLHSITECLKFLQEDVRAIHGNLRKASFYLARSGELKVFGLELCTALGEPSSLLGQATRVFPCVPSSTWPAEVFSLSWNQVQARPPSGTDSWMLARFIQGLFSPVPPILRTFCKEAQQIDGLKRPPPATLLEPSIAGRLFANPIIGADARLRLIAAVDLAERDLLFAALKEALPQLPKAYVSYKLVLLVTETLEAQVTSIEGIGLVLASIACVEEQVRKANIIPFILEHFSKPDRAVRMQLLDRLDAYLGCLDDKTIQDSVFGHFASGFTDAMPELRERTLKASLLLAPRISTRQLNNDLLRAYSRAQVDEQPGIRVNALICLGKVLPLLEPGAKAKILVTAVGRALQDPFAPAKSAALKVLNLNYGLLPLEVLCRSIMPLAAPMLLDRDPGVKAESLQLMKALLAHIEGKGLAQASEGKPQQEKPEEKTGLNILTAPEALAKRPAAPMVVAAAGESQKDGWEADGELADMAQDLEIEASPPATTFAPGWSTDLPDFDPWAE